MAALFLGFAVVISLGLNTLAGRLEFDSKGGSSGHANPAAIFSAGPNLPPQLLTD